MEQLDEPITTEIHDTADEDYVPIASMEPLTHVVTGEPDEHWEDKLAEGDLAEHRRKLEDIVRAQQQAERVASDVFVGI